MRSRTLILPLALLAVATPAFAGAHTWDVNEIFSNADGTIQFIELREAGGGAGEIFVGGHHVTSLTGDFIIPENVESPTSFRHLLFATVGFAALPGAPTPDYTIADNFFSLTADTITYVPYDSLSFGSGQLPTDGVLSFHDGGIIAANSPTNYAGETGSVNAAPPPPPVPDGSGGTSPMIVLSFDPGTSLVEIDWDVTSCSPSDDHHVLIGQGSDLPASPGGTFGLQGAECSVGASPPFQWTVPDPSDGSGLTWWLVVVDNGDGREGSWGLDSAATERNGPGAAGSSGECLVTTKEPANTCP